MTGMEKEALDAIAENGDRLHYYSIAQGLRISSHYAYVICKGLERNGSVDFDALKGICSLTEKGKDIIEKNWLLKLKSRKERTQEKIKEDKKRILRNVKAINY